MKEPPTGWTHLPEEHLPQPNFWPAGLALGITMMLWGLVSSWVILFFGAVLLVRSLYGWINALRRES